MLNSNDPKAWALDEEGYANGYVELAGGIVGYPRSRQILVERSAASDKHSTFLEISDENELISAFLTADEAEAMATVLMYTATKWREGKEAQNGDDE